LEVTYTLSFSLTLLAFQTAGFDFIELTGGNYEKWVMGPALRDSTEKRESYFGKFAKDMRKELKKTIVYVTGGFRTVPGMVRALEDGDADGFGLGRPTTAEPGNSLFITLQGAFRFPWV
jgi:2,4-dienoyl-CoA reductase-like NADH-dependent reductase (Old Yellow Enzyme family)